MPITTKTIAYAAMSTTKHDTGDVVYKFHSTNYELDQKTCWWIRLPQKVGKPLSVIYDVFKLPANTNKIQAVKHLLKLESYTMPKGMREYLEKYLTRVTKAPKVKRPKTGKSKKVTVEVLKKDDEVPTTVVGETASKLKQAAERKTA